MADGTRDRYLFHLPKSTAGKISRKIIGWIFFANPLAKLHQRMRGEFYRPEVDRIFGEYEIGYSESPGDLPAELKAIMAANSKALESITKKSRD